MTAVFLLAIVAAVAFGVGGLVGVWTGLSIANEPSEVRHGDLAIQQSDPRLEGKPQSIRWPRETS